MTQLRVAGGGSHYLAVMRDCEGNPVAEGEATSFDVGMGIDHKFGGQPLMVGVNAGYLRDEPIDGPEIVRPARDYYFVNPNVGVMTRRFGLSVGAAWFSDGLNNPDDIDFTPGAAEWLPTAAMRIGDIEGFYMTFSLLSGLPTYSGAGYFDIGGGWTLSDRVALWTGVNIVGVTATSVEGRLQWQLSDGFYSDVGMTVGAREGEPQYSANLGLTWRVIH